jgi:hypothetical protein
MAVNCSALRADKPLTEERFLILLLETEKAPVPQYRKIRPIENSNDLTRIRTRNNPACSIASELHAPFICLSEVQRSLRLKLRNLANPLWS